MGAFFIERISCSFFLLLLCKFIKILLQTFYWGEWISVEAHKTECIMPKHKLVWNILTTWIHKTNWTLVLLCSLHWCDKSNICWEALKKINRHQRYLYISIYVYVLYLSVSKCMYVLFIKYTIILYAIHLHEVRNL